MDHKMCLSLKQCYCQIPIPQKKGQRKMERTVRKVNFFIFSDWITITYTLFNSHRTNGS